MNSYVFRVFSLMIHGPWSMTLHSQERNTKTPPKMPRPKVPHVSFINFVVDHSVVLDVSTHTMLIQIHRPSLWKGLDKMGPDPFKATSQSFRKRHILRHFRPRSCYTETPAQDPILLESPNLPTHRPGPNIQQ